MNNILHVIQQLNQGGATRSLIASSKYSTRLNAGTYRHRVLSMTPADPHSLSQAREAGLEVVDEPGTEDLFREISQADIVQVHWWNNAVLQRLLHQDLPEMRLIMWYHVAGNAVPQIITPDLVRMADLNVVTHPCTYHDLPVFRYMPPSERSERVTLVVDPADFEMVERIKFKAHDTFNVGYMGALNAINRHPDYVPMSAGIQVPNIKFVV